MYKNSEWVKLAESLTGPDFPDYDKSAKTSMVREYKNPEWVKLVESLAEMSNPESETFMIMTSLQEFP